MTKLGIEEDPATILRLQGRFKQLKVIEAIPRWIETVDEGLVRIEEIERAKNEQSTGRVRG